MGARGGGLHGLVHTIMRVALGCQACHLDTHGNVDVTFLMETIGECIRFDYSFAANITSVSC